jgi:hypothetical protein
MIAAAKPPPWRRECATRFIHGLASTALGPKLNARTMNREFPVMADSGEKLCGSAIALRLKADFSRFEC